MSAEAKSVRLRVRNSDPAKFHMVTPSTWKRMQEREVNRAFYVEDPIPTVPKEVAAKVATNKDLADKKTASDKHESTTNPARLPDQNAGKVE